MISLKSIETVTKEVVWFEYRQNNSGGSFEINDDVSIYVLIQADDRVSANRKAEEVGIYFDGVSEGHDCSCCGDRWSEPWDELEEFSVYSWAGKGDSRKIYDNVLDYAQALADGDMWAEKGKPSVIVYFANGVKRTFYKQ
jgi:hypothetical protein